MLLSNLIDLKFKAFKLSSIEKILLVIILMLGLLVRLYFLFKYGNEITLKSDDWGYTNSAKALINTGILTYGHHTPTAFIMPAFPLFLSFFIRMFGLEYGLIAARFVQIIICMIGFYFIYLISTRLIKNKIITLIPITILLFYPPSIITPNLLITETWYTTLMIICVYLCIAFLDVPSFKHSLLLGLFFALALYFRPIIILVPIIVCLILLFLKRQIAFVFKIKLVIIWAGIMILCLSPWWIRNYINFNTFIPLTAASGNPLLYGTYINYEGIKNSTRPDWPKEKNEFENDKLQKEMAIKRIKSGFKENFVIYTKWYTLGKSKYMWKYPFDWYTPKEFSYGYNIKYHNFILYTAFLGVLLYIFRKPSDYFMLLIFISYSTILYMIYVTSARYCYPQIYLVTIFSGFLIDQVIIFSYESIIKLKKG